MQGYYDNATDRFITAEEAEQEEKDMKEIMEDYDREADARAYIEQVEQEANERHTRIAQGIQSDAVTMMRSFFGGVAA